MKVFESEQSLLKFKLIVAVFVAFSLSFALVFYFNSFDLNSFSQKLMFFAVILISFTILPSGWRYIDSLDSKVFNPKFSLFTSRSLADYIFLSIVVKFILIYFFLTFKLIFAIIASPFAFGYEIYKLG